MKIANAIGAIEVGSAERQTGEFLYHRSLITKSPWKVQVTLTACRSIVP